MKILGILVALCLTLVAFGQAVLKPNGEDAIPLELVNLDVAVTVQGGVASSTWTFIFRHGQSSQFEADFLYKLAPRQVATGFAYWFGEEKVMAHVVEKERAREIYQHITSRLRDPALIEMVGDRTFRARIFPVEPNKDLKVEMTFVEALADDGRSLSLTLPIEQPAGSKLAALNVAVRLVDRRPGQISTNYGIAASETPGGASVSLSGENMRPNKPLTIRIDAPSGHGGRALAKRSGGPDGFFAWTVPASQWKKGASVAVDGVEAYDVLPPEPSSDGVVVVGRYRKAGAATLRVGSRVVDRATFGADAAPNHGGVKLWAARKIEVLGNQAKAVTALSLRHTIPSKYTSWLAIPKAERERYEREKAQEELYELVGDLAVVLERDGPNSPKAIELKRLIAETMKKAGTNDVHYAAESGLSQAMERLAKELAAGRRNSRKAMNARRAIQHMPWVSSQRRTELLSYANQWAIELLASQYVRDELLGNRNADAQRRRTLMRELGVKSKQLLDDDRFYWIARHIMYEAAREAIELEWTLGPNHGKAVRQRQTVERMRRNRETLAEPIIREAHEAFYVYEYWESARVLVAARQKRTKAPTVAAAAKRHARIHAHVRPYSYLNAPLYLVSRQEGQTIYDLGQHRQKGQTADVDRLMARLDAAAKPFGATAKDLLSYADIYTVDSAISSVIYAELQPLRNKDDIAARLRAAQEAYRRYGFDPEKVGDDVRRGLENAHKVHWVDGAHSSYSYRTSSFSRYYMSDAYRTARDPLVIELHKRNPDWKRVSELERRYLSTSGGRPERLAVLRAETEIDRLLQLPPDPEVLAQIEAKKKRAAELRARMGDPLILAEFPYHCKSVVAFLPDGNVQPLEWNAEKSRWETRFDIPTTMKEGRVDVRVVALYPDGRRAEQRFTYHVDTTKPEGQTTIVQIGNLLRIECRASADVARATAWSGVNRYDMRFDPVEGVWFAEIPLLEAGGARDILIVLTDKAHNKRELRLKRP